MKEIAHLLNKYISINPFSGQIMVARQNKIIDKLEYGYKDFETKAHFLEQQLFPIASITKQFTTVGILYHVDRGVMELNQTLNYYLPINHSLWQGSMPEWATQITIHHLLTNSSGLPNYYLRVQPLTNVIRRQFQKFHHNQFCPKTVAIYNQYALMNGYSIQ